MCPVSMHIFGGGWGEVVTVGLRVSFGEKQKWFESGSNEWPAANAQEKKVSPSPFSAVTTSAITFVMVLGGA